MHKAYLLYTQQLLFLHLLLNIIQICLAPALAAETLTITYRVEIQSKIKFFTSHLRFLFLLTLLKPIEI